MKKGDDLNKVTGILPEVRDRTFFMFIGVSLFEESHALIIEPKNSLLMLKNTCPSIFSDFAS